MTESFLITKAKCSTLLLVAGLNPALVDQCISLAIFGWLQNFNLKNRELKIERFGHKISSWKICRWRFKGLGRNLAGALMIRDSKSPFKRREWQVGTLVGAGSYWLVLLPNLSRPHWEQVQWPIMPPKKCPLAYTLVQMHQHGPHFIFMHWDVLQPFNNLNPGLSIGHLGWTNLCKPVIFFFFPAESVFNCGIMS